jgi:hypothetical protein
MARKPRRPAITDEGRESQVISAAIDLAEKQIRAGTASAAVITHFVKLGSTRERLEQQRLRSENELLKAKVDSYASAAKQEELFERAIAAMASYSGQEVQVRDEDDQML